MKPEIIKSYFHPTYPEEIIVVEANLEGQKIRKQILWDEVLNHLMTVPPRQLPDKKVLKKAEELVLSRI